MLKLVKEPHKMLNKLKMFQKTKPEIKVILLGDSGVGKTTSLINIFGMKKENGEEIIPNATILIDTLTDKSNPEFDLVYYDTAGQERFQSIVPSYFRQADIALIVFDIMKSETHRNALNVWLEMVNDINQEIPCKVFMVGNKIDLLETSLDYQRLNDPTLHAIDNDLTLKFLGKNDLESYEKLREEIKENALQVLEWRKEHAGQFTDYFTYGYWFPKEELETPEKHPFDEVFKEIYGDDWEKNEDKSSTCCTIS